MACSWTYEHYTNCINNAKRQGYQILPFNEVESTSPMESIIILRHDIDISVTRALNMAMLESTLGIRASYFVRVHASSYNIFEYNTYNKLKKILSLGHEIGLHFEAVDFSTITGENSLDIFLREKKVLETILNTSVKSAAAHGEHTTVGATHNRSFFQNINKSQVNIEYNTYDPAFTENMKYISDSSGRWREGCMCNHIGKYQQMQILIHPCWWFKDHLFE